MELKFDYITGVLPRAQCFNRTFMELKYNNKRYNNMNKERFNRTFMELKFWYFGFSGLSI